MSLSEILSFHKRASVWARTAQRTTPANTSDGVFTIVKAIILLAGTVYMGQLGEREEKMSCDLRKSGESCYINQGNVIILKLSHWYPGLIS